MQRKLLMYSCLVGSVLLFLVSSFIHINAENLEWIPEEISTFAVPVEVEFRIAVVDKDSNAIVKGDVSFKVTRRDDATKIYYADLKQYGDYYYASIKLLPGSHIVEITRVPTDYDLKSVDPNLNVWVNGSGVTHMSVQIQEASKGFFSGLIGKIIEGFTDFIVTPLTNFFAPLFDFIGGLINTLIDGVVALGEFIVDALLALGKLIGDALLALGEFLKDLFIPKPEEFQQLFDNFMNFFSEKFGFLAYPFDYAINMYGAMMSGGEVCYFELGTFLGGPANLNVCAIEQIPMVMDTFRLVLGATTVGAMVSQLYTKFKRKLGSTE